jgi:hypothetical protein
LQNIRTETIEDVAGGYIPIIFLVLGLIFAGMYGGALGESWKTYKLDKFKAQSDLAAFLLVNFLIIILLFHIRFLNFLLTLFIAAIIAWFLSALIITFPPIYNRFNINKFKSRMYPKTLFKPKWFNLLPSNLRPDKKRISELEKLRRAFNLSHEVLAAGIMSSPETTRKVQRQMLRKFRNTNPEAPEKELLKMVLISRITSPPSIDMTEQEMDQAMENINSFDELCDYIIALDEKESLFPDISGIGKKTDKILAQEEIEKKAPKRE